MISSPTSSRALLGAAIRQLGHDVVGHQADDELLDDLAATLREYSARLSGGGPRSRDKQDFHDHWDTQIAEGQLVESWSDRPFSGISSPWSVEPEVRRHAEGVRATVRFGSAHEGAPERCHGGIVAGLFDDILGSVLSVIGQGAFTGELTVRYVAPVPLYRPLTCTCRIDGREGRKLFLSGELADGEHVLARATSIFIQPRQAETQTTFEPD
ncbi:unannotated protein [freshwater metagenome]|uniref:Acyl-coenzyme A thioesterase THEM4 n=1 Tax=freshwater metagenome TaxID=449393 RepID=A0A6J7EYG8_9ZZZZ|nr:hypothetical protein [Actinomycetota bacterium]